MTSRAFAIRPMRASDLDRVLGIAASLRNTPHWPRAAYLTALDEQAPTPRVALVAVTAQDEVAGYAIASLLGQQAELETIAVSEEFQRQGIGLGLLERTIVCLREARVRELWLEVRVSNEAAAELYRGRGFVRVGVRKRYYSEPPEDAFVMVLTIG